MRIFVRPGSAGRRCSAVGCSSGPSSPRRRAPGAAAAPARPGAPATRTARAAPASRRRGSRPTRPARPPSSAPAPRRAARSARCRRRSTAGGVITFNCGAGPVTIPVTATLNVPVDQEHRHRRRPQDHARRRRRRADHALRQRELSGQRHRPDAAAHRAVNGKATPTEAIPTAPAPCSQGWNDGEGGALYMRDGYLTVIDSIFTDNQAAPLGPRHRRRRDLRARQQGRRLDRRAARSPNNHASNAGAVGGLFAELNIYNSLFTDNNAIGHDANNNDPSKCSAINNGQNEIGSGGNGGAIYSDGNDVERHPVRRRDPRTTPPARTRSAAACSSPATTSAAPDHRRHDDDRQHRRPLDAASRPAASPTPAPRSAPTPRASRSRARRSRALRAFRNKGGHVAAVIARPPQD